MKSSSIIILLFIILSATLTYPLVLQLTSSISGFTQTDEPYEVLWNFWRINYSHHNNLDLKFSNLIAYPFGVDFTQSFPRVYLWDMMTFLFGISMNPPLAYNIQILISYILSGFFMYLLVFYSTKNKAASIFSGIIFTFCPQHFVRSWQHIGLAYFQWMPLYLLTLFRLKETPDFKNYLMATGALLLLASFDTHYFYFMLITTLLFAIFILFYRIKLIENIKGNLRFIKYLMLAGFSTIVLTLPQYYLYLEKIFKRMPQQASAWNPFQRNFQDLFIQSAKPLSYILPSTEHPMFGGFTKHFVGSSLWGTSYTEHQLFLGWLPLILAFVAFRRWQKMRKIRNPKSEILNKSKIPNPKSQINPNTQYPNSKVNIINNSMYEDFYIGFFIFLAIAAWFFSQPPWWKFGSVRIFMPPFFMYKILPMVRAYCRFGVVVMLAVSVLAGFGLKFILERFKTQKAKILITCLFSGLVLFEFLNFPPFKVIDLTKYPKVYNWLKEQPDEMVIAEYPLDVKGPSKGPSEHYKFYQTIHHKKIINGVIEGTHPHKILQTIMYLSKNDSPKVLKWLGVKYVLVHKELYNKTGLVDVLDDFKNIGNNRGLKFTRNFDDIYVYEVVAEPKEPDIYK